MTVNPKHGKPTARALTGHRPAPLWWQRERRFLLKFIIITCLISTIASIAIAHASSGLVSPLGILSTERIAAAAALRHNPLMLGFMVATYIGHAIICFILAGELLEKNLKLRQWVFSVAGVLLLFPAIYYTLEFLSETISGGALILLRHRNG